MSETKKGLRVTAKGLTVNDDVIYKCPMCFSTLNDVTIFPDEDGVYRCLKCGYNDTYEGLLEQYARFRSRYKLITKRLTLEEQRNM